MKKVLIIAYYFPPLGGGGVQRPLKFCKYLPEFNWQPIVLTSKNGVGPVYDEILLGELNTYKYIKVYRTLSFELGAIKKLFFGEKRKRKDNYELKSKTQKPKESAVEERKIDKVKVSKIKSICQNFYNIIFKILKKICIPDDKILWALPSFFSALRIIKKENPDLIFTTIPPYSSFILAVLLKKCTGKKLVVDYRDPWCIPNSKNNFFNLKLEKWCLKHNDNIVYVVPKIKEWLENQFDISNVKTELIYNGYDEDDYKDIEPIKFDKWTMISGGDLYDESNKYFFEILEEFFNENKDLKKDIQFIICSNYHKWFEKFLNNSPIKDNIINTGSLPKKEYLSLLKSSDIAVLFTGYYKDNIEIHGRIFDYLSLNKRILPILNENSAHENILKFIKQDIVVFRRNEKEKIKQFIKSSFESRNNKNYISYNIKNFDRKKLTEILVGIFN